MLTVIFTPHTPAIPGVLLTQPAGPPWDPASLQPRFPSNALYVSDEGLVRGPQGTKPRPAPACPVQAWRAHCPHTAQALLLEPLLTGDCVWKLHPGARQGAAAPLCARRTGHILACWFAAPPCTRWEKGKSTHSGSRPSGPNWDKGEKAVGLAQSLPLPPAPECRRLLGLLGTHHMVHQATDARVVGSGQSQAGSLES